MDPLEKELQELVSKHLPQVNADALPKRLDQADADAKSLSEAKAKIVRLETTQKEMVKEIETYQQNQARIEVIEKGEKDLASNQRALEIERLTYKLDCEKEKTKMAVDLNMSLTRNTLFRKDIFDSEYQQPYQGPNGWTYPTPVNKSFNETKSEE